MKISLIIPTYNGAHKILRVLKSIERQTCLPDEILVVIDGSADNTEELLLTHTFSFADRLKVVSRENGGRSKVRNTGAREAQGELLLFIDDDMELREDCVQRHIAHHLALKHTILTGAQIIPENPELPDFQNYRAWLTQLWSAQLHTREKAAGPDKVSFITAANFSILKSDFVALGMFDEMLTDGEDFDLSYKAGLARLDMYYDERAFAWHHDVLSCYQTIKRQRDYRNAGIALAKARPDQYGPLFGSRLQQDRSLKAYLFLLFCSRYWISMIDKNVFVPLPKKIRYKIYDLVLTANTSFWPQKLKL
jgi:glycosyltransferase involved in cell wall biosynthesis